MCPDLHRRVSEALDDLLSYVNQEWWNCNGGKSSHEQIERKRAEIEALRADWERTTHALER